MTDADLAVLVDQTVAYARDHLGDAAARRIGVDAVTEGDVLLDAVCVLSCAGEYPPEPLGSALAEAVAGPFGDSQAFETDHDAAIGRDQTLTRA